MTVSSQDVAWFKAQEREAAGWRAHQPPGKQMDKQTITSQGKTVAWIKRNPNAAAQDIEHLTELLASREADVRQTEKNHREMVHKLKEALG